MAALTFVQLSVTEVEPLVFTLKSLGGAGGTMGVLPVVTRMLSDHSECSQVAFYAVKCFYMGIARV